MTRIRSRLAIALLTAALTLLAVSPASADTGPALPDIYLNSSASADDGGSPASAGSSKDPGDGGW